jgi:hypothetical protein
MDLYGEQLEPREDLVVIFWFFDEFSAKELNIM